MDPGCVQKDFIHIDPEETFRGLRKFLATHEERLTTERRWLKENRIDLTISDAPSFPLQASRDAGIPSLLIANFTWHDIYSRLPGAETRQDLLDILRGEYSKATVQLLPQCHIDNEATANRKVVGFIAMKGNDIREELERALPRRAQGKTLVFIYLGLQDSSCIQWKRLQEIEDCIFITRDPLSAGSAIDNLHVLGPRYRYQDLIASADIVCTKAGYSTLATAFRHGKPVISCSRGNFSEFEAVKDFLDKNRVGLIIDSEKFYAGDWAEDIQEARQLTVKGKVKLAGEREAFKTIEDLAGTGA